MKDQEKTIPGKCPTCDRCRIYIEGPRKGRCVHGGPYLGYVRVILKDGRWVEER